MIHSVSFGDFASEVAKPVASQAQAASGMRSRRHSTESSVTKTVVTTVGVVAVLAAALALLRGKVASLKDIDLTKGMSSQEGFMAKCKYGIAKAGQMVIDGFNRVKSYIPFIGKKAEAAAETVAENTEKL